MKSRFSRSVCWSVFIFCLACNARAETPAPASKNKYERMTSPNQAEINGDKPVLIDNQRIQGHHEYEAGPGGEAELRRRHVISADPAKSRQKTEGTTENNVSPERARSTPEAPEAPGTAGIGAQQNYTRSPALKSEPAVAGSPTEAENRENRPAPAGAERITGHAAQEDGAALRRGGQPGGVASQEVKRPGKVATPVA